MGAAGAGAVGSRVPRRYPRFCSEAVLALEYMEGVPVTAPQVAALPLARRAADLATKARDTTAKHVEQAQAFFDAGMMVESDLLQARVPGLRHVVTPQQLAQPGETRLLGIAREARSADDTTSAPAWRLSFGRVTPGEQYD